MDPFVAEIRIFPFNFAPKGWAFCDGQLMALSQNTALFSLLGTTYGGNGKSNFALPNLQGKAPMHPGQGPGLSLHDLGEMGGSETVTLLESDIPSHNHALMADALGADTFLPANAALSSTQSEMVLWEQKPVPKAFRSTADNLVALNPAALAPTGGGQPHNNMQPYLTLNFCIALQGVYPPRT